MEKNLPPVNQCPWGNTGISFAPPTVVNANSFAPPPSNNGNNAWGPR